MGVEWGGPVGSCSSHKNLRETISDFERGCANIARVEDTDAVIGAVGTCIAFVSSGGG